MKGIIMESRLKDRHGISRRFVIPEKASLLDLNMTVSMIMWGELMADSMTVLSPRRRDVELFGDLGLEAPLGRMKGCVFEFTNLSHGTSVCETVVVGKTDGCYQHAAELIELEGDIPADVVSEDTDYLSDMVRVNDNLVQTGILGCPVPGWRRIDLTKRLEIIRSIQGFDALALFYRWETGDVVRVDDPEMCERNGSPPPDIPIDDLDPEDPAYSFICAPTMELMSLLAEMDPDIREHTDEEDQTVVTDPSSISVLLRRLDQRVMEIPMEWAERNHVSFVLDMDGSVTDDGDICR